MLFLLNTSVTPDRNQTVVALLQEAHVLEIQSDVASRSHLNQKFTLRLHLHALTKTDWTDYAFWFWSISSGSSLQHWPDGDSSVRAQMLRYLWQLFIPELKPFSVLWVGEICSRIFQHYPYRKTERRNYLRLPCTVSLQRSVTATLFPLFKEKQRIMLMNCCFSDM